MIAWYYIAVMPTYCHQNIPIRFLDLLRQPKKLYNLPQKMIFMDFGSHHRHTFRNNTTQV